MSLAEDAGSFSCKQSREETTPNVCIMLFQATMTNRKFASMDKKRPVQLQKTSPKNDQVTFSNQETYRCVLTLVTAVTMVRNLSIPTSTLDHWVWHQESHWSLPNSATEPDLRCHDFGNLVLHCQLIREFERPKKTDLGMSQTLSWPGPNLHQQRNRTTTTTTCHKQYHLTT